MRRRPGHPRYFRLSPVVEWKHGRRYNVNGYNAKYISFGDVLQIDGHVLGITDYDGRKIAFDCDGAGRKTITRVTFRSYVLAALHVADVVMRPCPCCAAKRNIYDMKGLSLYLLEDR